MDTEIKWCLIRIGFEAEKVVLRPGITSFGRTPRSSVRINSPYCSRTHCSISIEGDMMRLRDQNVSFILFE